MDRDWKSFEIHARNMNIKDNSSKVTNGNKKYVIGNQRKGNLCPKMQRTCLAELCLCSCVLWKVELMSDKIEYLVVEISRQNVQRVVLFLLTAYRKMREQRDELKRNW